MKRIVGTGIAICSLSLALLLAAAGMGYGGQQNQSTAPKTALVAGMIYFVAPNGAITIIPPKEKIDAAPRAVILANSRTRITRDQKPATVANLQEGDSVQAEYIPATGEAITIRATSR